VSSLGAFGGYANQPTPYERYRAPSSLFKNVSEAILEEASAIRVEPVYYGANRAEYPWKEPGSKGRKSQVAAFSNRHSYLYPASRFARRLVFTAFPARPDDRATSVLQPADRN